jgi:iron complex outermembrane receptor protein
MNWALNASEQEAALAGTTQATALNPYDPASSDSSVLDAIADYLNLAQDTDQDMFEVRVVIDGALGSMGGGDIRVAAGLETREEGYHRKTLTGPLATGFSTAADVDRRVNSIFAEAYLPVTETLELSLAARYDDYDDVGDTTNPKIGVTWQPSDAVSIRGSWGTSFHAPSLADIGAPLLYEFIPVSPFREADSPFFPDFFRPTILFSGAAEGLKPEEAETFSIGGDFQIGPDLMLSVTYWDLLYEDRMDQNASFFFTPAYYEDPVNADFFIRDPASPQEIRDTFGDHPVAGFPSLEVLWAVFGQPYVVSNQNKMNMGSYDLSGLDFSLDYSTDLGGGALDASLSGTYLLKRDKEQLQGSGFTDTLEVGDFARETAKLNLVASLGWGNDAAYVSGTVYHRGSADVGSESIDSFTTLDLYGSYYLNDTWSLMATVENALDEEPPFRISDYGVAFLNKGRVITLGVKAEF